jgi:hypothetical protein
MFSFTAMILVMPVANIFCYLLIGFYFGWIASLIVLGCFLVALTI